MQVMGSNHNIKGKLEKIKMKNSKPTKIIRDKLEKKIQKSNLKNIDLKIKKTKFDTKKKTKSLGMELENNFNKNN